MGHLYRDKRWLEFRAEILELDGHRCAKCGRSPPEVTLQVHHKDYDRGKAPWEYPATACESLCKGCHAREHGKIRPVDGWSLCAEDDLRALHGECECCGTPIRYVFVIEHKGWEPMSVGTFCCDNLTGTTQATNHRRELERLKRFTGSKRWKSYPTGSFLKQRKWLEIWIRPCNDMYRIHMNGIAGFKKFKTEQLAKEFVFNAIENGTAQRFAEKHPLPWAEI